MQVYLISNGIKTGSFSPREIRAKYMNKEISSSATVWYEVLEDYIPLFEWKDFAPEKIHVAHQNNQIGVFTAAEINIKLEQSELFEQDIAWFDEIDSWIPVGEIPGVVLPSKARTPPLPSAAIPPPLPSISSTIAPPPLPQNVVPPPLPKVSKFSEQVQKISQVQSAPPYKEESVFSHWFKEKAVPNILAILFAVALVYFNPKPAQHYDKVRVLIKETLSNNSEPFLGLMLDFAGDEQMKELVTYDKFLFGSYTRLEVGKEKHIISWGVLGMVFTVSKESMQEWIDKEKQKN